jgi:hypothetical protein
MSWLLLLVVGVVVIWTAPLLSNLFLTDFQIKQKRERKK